MISSSGAHLRAGQERLKIYGVTAYTREASQVFSSLSHPRRATQLTTAGAVRERSPAITPIKNACTYGGRHDPTSPTRSRSDLRLTLIVQTSGEAGTLTQSFGRLVSRADYGFHPTRNFLFFLLQSPVVFLG